MDIASKIAELNARTEELKKNIIYQKEEIVKNNALVRKLATQVRKTNEILGIVPEEKETA